MSTVMAKSVTVDRLRQLVRRRLNEGCTQGEFAALAGMKQSNLSRFLNEEDRSTSVETAERLAHALGLEITLSIRVGDPEKIST